MKKAMCLILFILMIALTKPQDNQTVKVQMGEAEIKENLSNVTMELYYLDVYSLTRFPLTVKDLIGNHRALHVMVDSEALDEHKELIFEMLDTPTTVLDDKEDHCLNARVYYALYNDNGETLFNVAMWGTKGELFINGIPCEEEYVFYDVAIAFLPPDVALAFESYLEGDGAFEIPQRQGDGSSEDKETALLSWQNQR